jgi:G3E family GTPase
VTAPTEARPRLPLSVIGGFLGAGKTTLLNRLLRDSRGRRLAVLVNDFGAINIDADLVAANAGDTIALTNGCVCCSIGDDLTAALIRVIEAPVPFDAVVIEASGVSDPWRIAQVALADPALGLDAVTVLVDASACLDHAADPLLADSLRRQIEAADLLLVNKTDLVDAAQLRGVQAWLDSLAGVTPRFETRQGDVPMALLTSAALSTAGDRSPHPARHPGGEHGDGDHSHGHDHHADHGELFETWSARPRAPFPAAALRKLLREMPAGVLRLKGIVRTDELGWAELQFAGRHGSLRKALGAPPADAAVVAIGMRGRLPVQALDRLLGSGTDQDTAW